jgi:hypothetical protein
MFYTGNLVRIFVNILVVVIVSSDTRYVGDAVDKVVSGKSLYKVVGLNNALVNLRTSYKTFEVF